MKKEPIVRKTPTPPKKIDDLLNDAIREQCKEQAGDCMETMLGFGIGEWEIDRSMRGLVTKLVQAGLIRVPTKEEQKPLYGVGVSVLLTNDKGQLLLAKRKNNSGAGLLSTPGGRIEFDETVEQCAAREFKEETLAELDTVKLLGWRKLNRFDKHYFMFYVMATSYSGQIENGIPDKSDCWTWFSLDKLNEKNCTEPADILSIVRLECGRAGCYAKKARR